MLDRLVRRSIIGAIALAAPIAAAGAQSDWPCQQPLAPTLSAAEIWRGPSIDSLGDWRADAGVAALVRQISPRDVSAEQGEEQIAGFLQTLSADRERRVTLAFAGLLDETNRERAEVIARVKDLGQRQRNLAALIDRLTAELDTLPAEPQGQEAARRAELQERLSFISRTYTDVQTTMRYACAAPAMLATRLGAYAKALESGLR